MTRAIASAALLSGSLPMSFDTIASTIEGELRLISCADPSAARYPVTMMSAPPSFSGAASTSAWAVVSRGATSCAAAGMAASGTSALYVSRAEQRLRHKSSRISVIFYRYCS
ncbi:MAG: hypothetical protein DI632_06295 [Sphingomonas hengshuiensis]|uniref:Uncharacterized protein n=1 Tax=Sphingomonas hengshuiensis TaxID=1609977 RepID=A0A2W4Z8J7_9SPHN|nr:MAG: hypothetical protein DI632_06295 [Sphingomonas hengshuiensis]